MNYKDLYSKKLKTAEEAVKVIQSGMWIDYGFCADHPVALDQALANRMEQESDLKNLNFRGGVSLWVPAVTQVTDAKERINWNSWHTTGGERKIVGAGYGYYDIMRYSELPRYYRENIKHIDVLMVQVTPMDKHGYFNMGVTSSHIAAAIEIADTVILEVNENMPVCMGGHETNIHINQVDIIVEGGNPPIGELKSGIATDVDKAVARYIVDEIPNGACLQLGIGGMPNAVGELIAESDLKDLGVHTEMYVDSFIDMSLAGKITGKCKAHNKGKQVFTFAAGTKKLYDYIDGNPEIMAAPVDYVNDIRIISELDNFMSINNAIEVDLYGQVVSETVGTRHISGSGGQQDFVLGAYLSKGGKSFICCSSTIQGKDGSLKSRLRPFVTPGGIVTCTRTNIHYLVTEYGIENLKGTSTWQRAEKIIGLAHPDFRDELIKEAEGLGIWCPHNKR
ncbi:MAG: butyryl-CoA:acetate CoA-transferase [Lachnospiraceae bacterium]|nr:butyryl-CoA:acetate CoA-transferase [Lachnospiraceae bacterium]